MSDDVRPYTESHAAFLRRLADDVLDHFSLEARVRLRKIAGVLEQGRAGLSGATTDTERMDSLELAAASATGISIMSFLHPATDAVAGVSMLVGARPSEGRSLREAIDVFRSTRSGHRVKDGAADA